jgi:hypothetical protein
MRIPLSSTWLVWPSEPQVSLASPARALRRLRAQGVEVRAFEDGVLSVLGPSSWFTEPNLDRLAMHARSLAGEVGKYLRGAPRYTPSLESSLDGDPYRTC